MEDRILPSIGFLGSYYRMRVLERKLQRGGPSDHRHWKQWVKRAHMEELYWPSEQGCTGQVRRAGFRCQ